jgi:hypothetical protein
MPKQQRYINVLFREDEIYAIDKFRFDCRLESRTEAIRKLIEYALKHQSGAAKG